MKLTNITNTVQQINPIVGNAIIVKPGNDAEIKEGTLYGFETDRIKKFFKIETTEQKTIKPRPEKKEAPKNNNIEDKK